MFPLGPMETSIRQMQEAPQLLALVDPDRLPVEESASYGEAAARAGVAMLLVGTSVLTVDGLSERVRRLKQAFGGPVLLFPGDASQAVPEADALLFLSLISGRNPQFLIGEQVKAAPHVARTKLECLPTAYMLVESGALTSVQFVSGSLPLPAGKPDIAAAHALAAQMLGMRLLYLEAGSGADRPVPMNMITACKQVFNGPLIVGGGMRSPHELAAAVKAGANFVVVGSAFENLEPREREARMHSFVQAVRG
jgi:phosphoglycerol geranylgeranyltransferase